MSKNRKPVTAAAAAPAPPAARDPGAPLVGGDIVEISNMRMRVNDKGMVVVVARRNFAAYYVGDVCGLSPPAAHREILDGNASLHSLSVVDAPVGDDDAEAVPESDTSTAAGEGEGETDA